VLSEAALNPNPILRVLSAIRTSGVQGLLLGGQACILYGAVEFSRDLDFIILLSPVNLDRLRALLSSLHAQVVAVPPLAPEFLERGHFVHFRCARPDVDGVRIDVATRLRGVAAFDELWGRRQTIEIPTLGPVEVLGLSDLVASKKTQRDKDWVMLRRIMEVDYFRHRGAPPPGRVEFWLRELRTPQLLIEAVALHRTAAERMSAQRSVLRPALAADGVGVERELAAEMERERSADREYWAPLRRELAELRRQQRGHGTS
jgi:hypothetical protein